MWYGHILRVMGDPQVPAPLTTPPLSLASLCSCILAYAAVWSTTSVTATAEQSGQSGVALHDRIVDDVVGVATLPCS
eukprot:5437730-Prymnesium_polylepis.1